MTACKQIRTQSIYFRIEALKTTKSKPTRVLEFQILNCSKVLICKSLPL